MGWTLKPGHCPSLRKIDAAPQSYVLNSEFSMRKGAMLLTPQPSLVEQAYEALLGEIADGTLAPDMHLVQELLAERYGVSRQPIQQAPLLLKTDGLVLIPRRKLC